MPKYLKKISNVMKDRGYNRDPKQCGVKIKELRQTYQKNREANGHSGSEPQTCRFYEELHAILGGAATTTPPLCFDSVQGAGGNTEVGFGGEEDEEEVVDSSQQGSGETGFPNSQDLFITLDLDPVPNQGGLPDPEGREGTSGCDTGLQGHGPVLPLRAPPGRVAGASSLLRGTDDTALNTAQGALRLFGHCSAPLTPIHSGPPWAPAQSLLRSWAVGFPFLVEGGPDGSANERVHFCAPRTSHLEGQLGERRLRAAVEPHGRCPAPTARARRDHWGPR
ncbi:hypothetical protein UY3_03322 [Chelonia mydas]|uniref:Myb/SANT-like DNA-binding domain-containing protein n=1 Tax=Chelonia mydas TaxID=8469 RepID=M7BUF9_CHEMY|nr:hypothetical protein UY3_03322 [Chelonia mydas]